MTGRARTGAVADYAEEKTFHVHKGPRTSPWLPRT
jgi:hypothetical protein